MAEKYAVRPQIEEYSTRNNIQKKRGSRNIFLNSETADFSICCFLQFFLQSLKIFV